MTDIDAMVARLRAWGAYSFHEMHQETARKLFNEAADTILALKAERDALRADIPGIWRCGVADAISAVDAVRPRLRDSKRKAEREIDQRLDTALQRIHDERMRHAPIDYPAAAQAGACLRLAAQALETDRDR